MLEIPESYNLAKQLNNTIVGKTISYVIANQSPGLGNGVLQDILYLSGIHPKRKMVDVSEDEYNKLFDVLKSTLRDMAEQGGRDTEKDLFGNPGGYKTYLSKNTAFTPCVKCGYELHKGNYMGGTIYYCEHCQK
ncbi:MAG: hypothetical protein GX379_00085 [Clostridiales bacterium]|nr:hypothetical protein [Clostridiales bacterium]